MIIKYIKAIKFFLSLWGSEWEPGIKKIPAAAAWRVACIIHLNQ